MTNPHEAEVARWEVEDCDHGMDFDVRKARQGTIAHCSNYDDAREVMRALNALEARAEADLQAVQGNDEQSPRQGEGGSPPRKPDNAADGATPSPATTPPPVSQSVEEARARILSFDWQRGNEFDPDMALLNAELAAFERAVTEAELVGGFDAAYWKFRADALEEQLAAAHRDSEGKGEA